VTIALRQNAVALAFVAGWMIANAVVFSRGRTPWAVLELVLGLVRDESTWGRIYQPFTQVVVFGAVASFIATNVLRRHRPEATARLLAGEARDHVVVIGHTHLGERVRDASIDGGAEVVVVDDDPGRISSILHEEAPLVLGDPRDEAILRAASIARAKLVVVAWDGAEVAAIAGRIVRKLNPSCELVLRCPDDDVGEVLARAYHAKVVSTSRLVAERVVADAAKRSVRKAVVFGDNAIGVRTHRALAERGIEARIARFTEDPKELAIAERADLVVLADDDLGKNLIRVDRLRDIAPHARIICRVFHEEAAEILTRPPFRCEVLSSSRLAVEMLAAKGCLSLRAVDGVRSLRAAPS
jgi:voltage-gated potassium channel Kch